MSGGDWNKRDASQAFVDFTNFNELQHGPTRGTEKLDYIIGNSEPNEINTAILNELETEGGVKSDHKVVLVQAGICLLYTSPSPRDLSTSRMPSSA